MAPNLEVTAQAFVVTSEPPRIAGRDPCVKRWGVLAESEGIAVEIVKERVSPECIVKASDEKLSPEELGAIHLAGNRALVL